MEIIALYNYLKPQNTKQYVETTKAEKAIAWWHTAAVAAMFWIVDDVMKYFIRNNRYWNLITVEYCQGM